MKIKQQQQIRSFLIREFGEEKGRTLFAQQESKLDAIIAGTADKMTNQMKTLGYGGDCCDFHFFRK